MLKLPSKRLGVSTKSHNNNLMVLCDWIEASLLISGLTATKATLSDLLLEEHIYADQDLCAVRMEDIWAEITRRQMLLGPAACLSVSGQRIRPIAAWNDCIAYVFCLICSLKPNYQDWTKTFGRSHSVQGALFEQLCESALRHRLTGWSVVRTGWGGTNTSSLPKVVRDLALFLGDDVGNLVKYAPRKGKEAGVDIAFTYPMPDRMAGPRYLAQCASGDDWNLKLKQLDLRKWSKYIDFVVAPQRVLVIPFAITADEYVQHAPSVGVLVERYRLLSLGLAENVWLPKSLAQDIAPWLQPRVTWLQASGLTLDPA